MRILHVNHGYPMRYNAGSEVYTRNLARALARAGHEVAVFARQEDPWLPEHAVTEERDGPIPVHLVNTPRSQHRFTSDGVDRAFADVLRAVHPQVVHLHHLNHLSLGLPEVARAAGIPVVFTVHDFWLACPRGQLLRWSLGPEPWPLCEGQDDATCARECYARCHTGLPGLARADLDYWAAWVHARMAAVEQALAAVDRLVCPSRTVARSLVCRFPAVEGRILLQDYGFPEALPPTPRRRAPGEPFTFGYIGTHTAPKGLDLLVRAFLHLTGSPLPRLRIWGRPRGQATEALHRMAAPAVDRISILPEYENDEVHSRVLPSVDAIVVPSIWLENSPLVIHEAQQDRVCVVTADAGGMAELVRHEENGLLFRFRDEVDLARQMQRLVDVPDLAARLGVRGYLGTTDGEVPTIDAEAARFADLYGSLAGRGGR